MIQIRESKPPVKYSGLSSFIITFPYDEKIVAAMKTLPQSRYDKKGVYWEIPAEVLSQALDTLTFLDDIQLVMAEDLPQQSGGPPLSENEIEAFSIKPFQHQIEGVNFGLSRWNNGWLLLDSMGCGKTLEIIMYAETLKRRGLIEHCLIICGVDSLRQNWKAEIRKCSSETCMVLGEKIARTGRVSYTSVADRANRLKKPIDEFFVVINAATLNSKEIIEALRKGPNKFGLIAVDEVHKFGPSATRTGNLLKLDADFKVVASGSLITNDPLSSYTSLSFTGNDHATLTNFKAQYCEYGGFGNKQIVGYKNLEGLREEIDECSLRRTLDQVRSDMPPKSIVYELVEMSTEHQKFYDAIREGVKEEADRIELRASNLLALTSRLRQATACPGVLTTQAIKSSKVERLVEVAEDLLQSGEKVVIFSVFKDTAYAIANALEKWNPTINTGDQEDSLIARNKELFQTDPDARLFIGTHAKCGTGITLNAASYMLLADTPWTWSDLAQSTDRIWRVTNTRPAIIMIFTCSGTVDERVRDIVDSKRDLADYLVDGKPSENFIADLLQIIRDL